MSNASSPARSYGIFILLVALLGMSLLTYFYPRTSTLSADKVKDLATSVENLKLVAENIERNTYATASLNRTLIHQLQTREQQDDSSYNEMLKLWGIDIDNPDAFHIDERLLQRSDDLGGGYLPASPKFPSDLEPLQGPGESFQSPANGSPARTAKPQS